MTGINERKASALDNERGIETTQGLNPIDVHVGYQVRLHRIAAGMSEAELAAAIGVGVPRVQAYEKGEKRVGANILYEISMVLECIPTVFFEDL
jgi:DNA-binding transcriptional regulator YiaG